MHPADFAENAEQAGVSHYLMLDGIRQAMLNLFAAALYHAFEQQTMLFHRREVLKPAEENDHTLLKFSEFQSRLARSGVDIKTFASWAKVEELRLVANAVKHAEGDSGVQLHRLRPDIFENPHHDQFGLSGARGSRIFQPLVGEDLYVSLTDIHDYCATITTFWRELSDAMQCV